MSVAPIGVRLTNRWATFTGYYPEELSDLFSWRAPNAFWSPKYKMGVWNGRIKLIKNRRMQSGVFLALRKEAIAAGFEFSIEDARVYPKFKKHASATSGRDYQVEAMDALVKHSNHGGIILCATGVGKTHIAGLYFSKLVGNGCFVVDELTLLDQAQEDIARVIGEKVGQIGDQVFDPQRITVATVQTLHRHRNDKRYAKWQKSLEVMFLDEIHQQINRRNVETIASIQPKAVFGLTATLELQKREVLCKATALTGPVIYRYPLVEGVDEGHLTPGVVLGVDLIRPRHKDATDYQSLYDLHIVRSRARNDMIEALVREAVRRDKFVILLLDRVAHVKNLFKRLSDLKVAKVHGDVKVKDRKITKAKFEKGKVQVIVTNKVFKKGVSINRVDVVIDGASMRSKNDAVQKYGRGVRLCGGKTGLIYIDIGEYSHEERHSLQKAASSRRAALRKAGITVVRTLWEGRAKRIFNEAEEALAAVLRKLVRTQVRTGGKRSNRHQ